MLQNSPAAFVSHLNFSWKVALLFVEEFRLNVFDVSVESVVRDSKTKKFVPSIDHDALNPSPDSQVPPVLLSYLTTMSLKPEVLIVLESEATALVLVELARVPGFVQLFEGDTVQPLRSPSLKLSEKIVSALTKLIKNKTANIPSTNPLNEVFVFMCNHFAVTSIYKHLCLKKYKLGIVVKKFIYSSILCITSKELLNMVLRSSENTIGAWAFLVGVILAIVIGLATSLASIISIPFLTLNSKAIYSILVLLGIAVGFFNVGGRESQTFLIAGAVLVIVSRFGMDGVTGTLIGIGIGDMVRSVFAALLTLFAPATIIVALKTVFSIAKV